MISIFFILILLYGLYWVIRLAVRHGTMDAADRAIRLAVQQGIVAETERAITLAVRHGILDSTERTDLQGRSSTTQDS